MQSKGEHVRQTWVRPIVSVCAMQLFESLVSKARFGHLTDYVPEGGICRYQYLPCRGVPCIPSFGCRSAATGRGGALYFGRLLQLPAGRCFADGTESPANRSEE